MTNVRRQTEQTHKHRISNFRLITLWLLIITYYRYCNNSRSHSWPAERHTCGEKPTKCHLNFWLCCYCSYIDSTLNHSQAHFTNSRFFDGNNHDSVVWCVCVPVRVQVLFCAKISQKSSPSSTAWLAYGRYMDSGGSFSTPLFKHRSADRMAVLLVSKTCRIDRQIQHIWFVHSIAVIGAHVP